jgi:hypothetical protein
MKPVRTVLSELLRRKVLRVMWIYLAVFLGFVATFVSIAPLFELEYSLFKWPFFIGLALIPIVAILSWRYDLVPPQLVRDPQDANRTNPALSWAAARHDARDAGFLLLAWQTDDSTRREKRFFQPVSIGRETGNDIEFPDPRVSRFHAVFWAEDGSWRIRDLDSANGTFIDAMRVPGSSPLPASCEIRFHPNGPLVTVCVSKAPETVIG